MGAKITIYLNEDVKIMDLERIINTIKFNLGSYVKDLKISDEVK